MKKVLSIILIICILVIGGGCKRKDMQGGAAAQVAVDPSENDMSHLKVACAIPEYFSPSNLSEMEEMSEYIVVATATESYSEAEKVYITFWGKLTENIDEADHYNSYAKRVFKVDKILKGEPTDEIVLREEWFTDGETLFTIFGEYAVNKGDKYLLFLYSATNTPNEYYAFLAKGKINLNGTQMEDINPNILKEIKESPKYKDLFE